jgi:hypothetical protein
VSGLQGVSFQKMMKKQKVYKKSTAIPENGSAVTGSEYQISSKHM